jgi:hypothetical protein
MKPLRTWHRCGIIQSISPFWQALRECECLTGRAKESKSNVGVYMEGQKRVNI